MVACARPDAESLVGACGQGQRPVFSPEIAGDAVRGEIFAVFEVVALPDGGAVVSYDPNTPDAGDDVNPDHQRLVQVDADGRVADLELPRLEGLQVEVNAVPLVADSTGSLYLYDRASSRIISRDPAGEWRTAALLDSALVFKSPHPSLGPDGALYLATASQVIRIDGSGEDSIVAGRVATAAAEIAFPQSELTGLPLLATEVGIPSPTALVVADDGVLHFATRDSLFRIARDGVLFPAVGLSGRIELPSGSGPPNFTGLAIDEEGRLLVSDSGNQQLLRINGAQVELVESDIRFIADGAVLTRPDGTPLLTVDADQQLVCEL